MSYLPARNFRAHESLANCNDLDELRYYHFERGKSGMPHAIPHVRLAIVQPQPICALSSVKVLP